MKKLRALLRRFSDESGAFAMYTAIVLPVFIAMIGFGLDYWSTLSIKARLDAAADTAAIAGAKAANVYVQTYGKTMSGQTLINAAITAGEAAEALSFNANAGYSSPLVNCTASATGTTPCVTSTVSFDQTSRKFTATVSYNTQRATSFAGILGVSALAVGGSATASQTELTYVNIYVLVDTSQSMGIAANQTEMTKLYNASAPYNYDGQNIGCVFGCHVPGGGQTVSMEDIAHKNGVNLRIDFSRAAIENMATSASNEAVNNNLGFYVYSLQEVPPPGGTQTEITQVYPYSGCTATNYSCMLTAFASTNYSVLDLGNNYQCCGYGDSNQPAGIKAFLNTLPTQGDGSSASSPKNYVYLITDGVVDTYGGSCYDTHCTSAFSPSNCTGLQQKATVGVIYTTYIPIYTQNNSALGEDPRYSGLIDTTPNSIQGMLAGNLQACATPSTSNNTWFYQATDDTALLNAMNNLFQSTMNDVQLTQ